MSVKAVLRVLFLLPIVLTLVGASGPFGQTKRPDQEKVSVGSLSGQQAATSVDQDTINVNDISYLWPAPKTKEDVASLISLEDTLADGISPILPKEAFDALLDNALQVRVNDSAGRSRQINFAQFTEQFRQARNWKIAAFRIDPSAPGTDPKLTSVFGSLPQIRLIVQPVTIDQGVVKIHDTTAHLVFSYIVNQAPPFQPDKKKFAEIVNDVRELKQFLKLKNVSTSLPLGVHPGLGKSVPGFPEKVKGFLQKHISENRMTAMAFMGISPPEPWIFFSLDKTSGKWALSKNPVVPGTVQMLMMNGGDAVSPKPLPLNIDGKRGVSTSLLFSSNSDEILDRAVFPEMPDLKFRDIPDFIANPARAHFFSTDCISCHTESTRRTQLHLDENKSAFRFPQPVGISGLDTAVAKRGIWNVRNFGWGDTTGIATVTQRTANEAAASADFINKNYRRNAMAKTVSHPLTLVMTIKGDKELKELVALLEGMQADVKNPVAAALDKLGTVHFARFVFLDDRHLAVITTFDNDFEQYIDAFVNEIGSVFDELLKRMEGAPPLPVSDHRKEFLEYVQRNDRKAASFYSAYPNLRVGDILTLQKAKQGP